MRSTYTTYLSSLYEKKITITKKNFPIESVKQAKKNHDFEKVKFNAHTKKSCKLVSNIDVNSSD